MTSPKNTIYENSNSFQKLFISSKISVLSDFKDSSKRNIILVIVLANDRLFIKMTIVMLTKNSGGF